MMTGEHGRTIDRAWMLDKASTSSIAVNANSKGNRIYRDRKRDGTIRQHQTQLKPRTTTKCGPLQTDRRRRFLIRLSRLIHWTRETMTRTKSRFLEEQGCVT